MSGAGGSFQPRPIGGFDIVYPHTAQEARALASAIRASGVRIGEVGSPCVSAATLHRARAEAAKLADLAGRFLAATGGPIPDS